MGVNSFPKTVARQHCGYDSNPGPSAPESRTLILCYWATPRQNIQNPLFFHQQLCYIIFALTFSCCCSPDFSVKQSEIHKILSNCPNRQSDSGPVWLLKECSSILIPTITDIVNSLISGQFPPTLQSLRNPLWIKMNSPPTGQSPIFLSYPK